MTVAVIRSIVVGVSSLNGSIRLVIGALKHQIGNAVSKEVFIFGPDLLPTQLMLGHRHAATRCPREAPTVRSATIGLLPIS